jgi:hypothetical protein
MQVRVFALSLGIIFLGLVSGGLSAAIAAPVTFSFTGVVGHVDTDLYPTFNTGQALTGSYTFESTTSVTNPGNRYNGAITAFNATLGSYSAVLGTGNNFIAVRDNLSTGDHYIVSAPLNPVPSVQGLGLRFRLELIDPSGNVFANTALPTTPPSLSSFATNRWRLVFEDSTGTARIRGVFTSLTAVPLPAAVILFGAGLIALAGLGAGGWRQRKNNDLA